MIINYEKVQARSDQEKRDAEAPPEGLRIEVPEERADRARRILQALEDAK